MKSLGKKPKYAQIRNSKKKEVREKKKLRKKEVSENQRFIKDECKKEDFLKEKVTVARSITKIKGPSDRMIIVGKPTYKKLIRDGYVHNNDNTRLVRMPRKRLYKKKWDEKRWERWYKKRDYKTAENNTLKKVLNPETGRLIIVGGPKFNQLCRKYKYDEEKNIFLVPEEKPLSDGEYWEINETSSTTAEKAKQLVIEARNTYGKEKESRYLKMTFYNHIDSLKKVQDCFDREFQRENNAFKINIAFGYVREKDGQVSLFKPGRNFFFDNPIVIKNKQDLENLKKAIDEQAIVTHLANLFKESNTRLLGVFAMAVKITRLDFLIGSKIVLPDYIKNAHFILGLEGVENNTCFWACMALAKGARRDRYKSKTKELFTRFYEGRKKPKDYLGFDYVNELDRYEEFDKDFAINIVAYYDDESIQYIRKSTHGDRPQIYLNLYLNHFSYITDLAKLAKKYVCERCGGSFRNNYDVQRHMETCSLTQIDTFNKFPTLWKKPRNEIVELSDYFDVELDSWTYDYLITFDFESILRKKVEESWSPSKTMYVSEHVPVSVALASNVQGLEEKFILSEDPKRLCKEMFEYIDEVSLKAKELMIKKMTPLIEKINNYVFAGDEKENDYKKDKYLNRVISYCSVIPGVGFNSSFYDINLTMNEGFVHEVSAPR